MVLAAFNYSEEEHDVPNPLPQERSTPDRNTKSGRRLRCVTTIQRPRHPYCTADLFPTVVLLNGGAGCIHHLWLRLLALPWPAVGIEREFKAEFPGGQLLPSLAAVGLQHQVKVVGRQVIG